MNQNIWGPHMWFTLHTISFNYPLYPSDTDKENHKTFIMTLKHVIPCSVCRKNFARNLKEMPPKLNSRKEFVYWLIDIHNEVNSLTGKKIMDRNKVIKMYEKKLNKKIELECITPIKPNSTNIYKILFLIISLSIIISMLLPKKYINKINNLFTKII